LPAAMAAFAAASDAVRTNTSAIAWAVTIPLYIRFAGGVALVFCGVVAGCIFVINGLT
jgi:hypothetical protein